MARPFLFFTLVFLLSIPFWLVGALTDGQLLPGLPVSAVMVVCPVLAAVLLVFRADGSRAVKTLLTRAGDFRRMRPWAWLVALGTMPLAMLLSGAVLVWTGTELPALEIRPLQVLGLCALFLLAATLEELGWTAYATRPLATRYGLVPAAMLIGLVAVLWHLVPLLQADRAWDWIGWWALGTVARRVIIVWLYLRGGESVFSTSLFHAMNNVSWMLFPVLGSHYDPVSTALIVSVFATLLVGIAEARASARAEA